jgi:hypothetical protein
MFLYFLQPLPISVSVKWLKTYKIDETIVKSNTMAALMKQTTTSAYNELENCIHCMLGS